MLARGGSRTAATDFVQPCALLSAQCAASSAHFCLAPVQPDHTSEHRTTVDTLELNSTLLITLCNSAPLRCSDTYLPLSLHTQLDDFDYYTSTKSRVQGLGRSMCTTAWNTLKWSRQRTMRVLLKGATRANVPHCSMLMIHSLRISCTSTSL